MLKAIIIGLVIFSQWSVNAQNIFLDEVYTDWDASMLIYEDSAGDGQSNGIDIKKIWMANDQIYIFIRFEVGREINIQDNNELTLYIDVDSDLNTGRKKNGIGAEFEYNFGNRSGSIYQADGDELFIGHEDIDMMSSPTVSSDQFEIGFRRSISEFGTTVNISGDLEIRIEDNGFNGDDAPNEIGGIPYSTDENISRDFHGYTIDRSPETMFRLMTYNILDDNLFDQSKNNAFRRQFEATNPDIIAFQEIRDFNSTETLDVIDNYLPGTWFHEKSGFDIVLLSRYPILEKEFLAGNAAFLLDVNGKEILVINVHLPCCDNNTDRQDEVDEIMAYIRGLRTDENDIKVAEGTPIIITGDTNLVGFKSQLITLLTGDILNNSQYGVDFNPDWDGTELEDAIPLATGTPYSKTWYNPFGSFSSGRLDYILYTGSAIELTNTFALSTRDMTSGDRATYGLNFNDTENASDHLPTVADFKLNTTSTAETSLLDIEVFPNPTTERLLLKGEISGLLSVIIYDSLGSKIKFSASANIDVSSLKNGIYFARVLTKTGTIDLPFTKI